MQSISPEVIEARIRAGLAMMTAELASIYRSERMVDALETDEVVSSSGYKAVAAELAARILSAPDLQRSMDIFSGPLLPSMDRLNDVVPLLFRTEFRGLLRAEVDRPKMVMIPGGGLVVNTPEGSIAIGVRAAQDHPAIARASVVIRSSRELATATPSLAPMGRTALVNGRSMPFEDRIDVNGLTLVRLNDYEVEILNSSGHVANASLFTEYWNQVAAISDTTTFMTAWKDHLRLLLWNLAEIQETVGKVLDAAGGWHRPDDVPAVHEIEPICKEIEKLSFIRACTLKAFDKSMIPSDAWERYFANSMNANFNNGVNTLFSIPGYLRDGSLTNGDLIDAFKSDEGQFSPFASLLKTVCLTEYGRKWLKADVPTRYINEPKVPNPVYLRELVDEIAFRAGLRAREGEPAHISFDYDEGMKRLLVRNESKGRNAFFDFEIGQERRGHLEFLAQNMGEGGRVDFQPDEEGTRIEEIAITLPPQSETGIGEIDPAGGTSAQGLLIDSETEGPMNLEFIPSAMRVFSR